MRLVAVERSTDRGSNSPNFCRATPEMSCVKMHFITILEHKLLGLIDAMARHGQRRRAASGRLEAHLLLRWRAPSWRARPRRGTSRAELRSRE